MRTPIALGALAWTLMACSSSNEAPPASPALGSSDAGPDRIDAGSDAVARFDAGAPDVAVPPDSGSTGPTPPSLPGTWTLDFDDEFNGTNIDTTKWCTSWFNGGSMNDVSTSAANVAVAGGELVLTQSSSTVGALVNTNPSDCGTKGYTFTTGFYAEARVYFPGSGSTITNWPAWWTNGQNWPATGEIDIAEGLGTMTSNYHSNSGANNSNTIAGTWAGAFHTYAVDREAGKNTIYFDGKSVRTYDTDDNGAPHYLIVNQGGSGATGPASQVKVDWARVWKK